MILVLFLFGLIILIGITAINSLDIAYTNKKFKYIKYAEKK